MHLIGFYHKVSALHHGLYEPVIFYYIQIFLWKNYLCIITRAWFHFVLKISLAVFFRFALWLSSIGIDAAALLCLSRAVPHSGAATNETGRKRTGTPCTPRSDDSSNLLF